MMGVSLVSPCVSVFCCELVIGVFDKWAGEDAGGRGRDQIRFEGGRTGGNVSSGARWIRGQGQVQWARLLQGKCGCKCVGPER